MLKWDDRDIGFILVCVCVLGAHCTLIGPGSFPSALAEMPLYRRPIV